MPQANVSKVDQFRKMGWGMGGVVRMEAFENRLDIPS